MIAMPILLVSMTLFSGTVVSMIRQRHVNREAAGAAQDVQSLFERMRNEDLESVFALYNNDPFDDPGGPGTAPGGGFEVFGLAPQEGAPGPVGAVVFPLIDVAAVGEAPVWQLREDLIDADLGMPRDLNGDHVIDALDHSGDYVVLPVIAQVRWRGEFGDRQLEMYTLLTRYRSDE